MRTVRTTASSAVLVRDPHVNPRVVRQRGSVLAHAFGDGVDQLLAISRKSGILDGERGIRISRRLRSELI